MKEKLKLIAFLVVLAIFITGATHIVFVLIGEDINGYGNMYWIMPIIIIAISLLSIFVITPIADWWMK